MKLMLLAARHTAADNCDVCGGNYYGPKRKVKRSRWLLTQDERIVQKVSICASCLREALRSIVS